MWTEDSEEHIERHDITPGEVEELVSSRPIYSTRGRDGTTLIYGVSTAGRHLLVVLTDAMDGRQYVVTARNMTRTEIQAFHAKGR